MTQPTLLVMAAGMGSRYGSLKQMDAFGPTGEAILDYSVYDAIRAGFGKVVFVIRKSIEKEFKEIFYNKFADKIAVEYVLQELDTLPEGMAVPAQRQKPWGTGHAVWVASGKIQEPFAVINADDYYGSESIRRMAEFLSVPGQADHCLMGYRLSNTLSEHGHVSRGICKVSDDHLLQDITERTQIYRTESGTVVYRTEQEGEVALTGQEIVSMNLMGFAPDVFSTFERCFVDFMQEYAQHPKKEFYLPSVVNEVISTGEAKVQVVTTPDSWFGVTYPEDKAVAQQKLHDLVKQGVYPENLWNS